ncbi:MAG: prolyl oligopeptidase family serine peptidase [Gemmatimonadaceae bacterium]
MTIAHATTGALARITAAGLIASSGLLAPLYGQAAAATPRRVMTVDDLIKEEEFGPLAPAPSGEWFAIVTQPNWCCYEPVFGSKLWLVSPATGERLAIGEQTFQRHWLESVLWSPDGSRLAIMARSLADGNAHLYVWSRKTATVDQVSSGLIAFQVAIGGAPPSQAAWLNDTTLVYAQVPDSPLATVDRSPENFFMHIAPRFWATMTRGVEPSAHVVESGVRESGVRPSIPVQLVSADLTAGTHRVLAAPLLPARYRRVFFHLSPDVQWAVVRAADRRLPAADTALTIDLGWREFVGVFAVRPASTPQWFARDLQQGSSVRWVGDSTVVITGSAFGGTQRTRWSFDRRTSRVESTAAEGPQARSAAEDQPQRPASVRLPAGARSIADFPVPGVTLHTMLTDSGSFAFAAHWSTGRTTQLMALNRYIAGIERGRRMLIEYRGNEGELLNGVVLLPPGYQPGKRYPVFTWVYAERMYRNANLNSFMVSDRPHSSLNMQVLAARGYVVLFPSIPLPPDSVRRDQYLAIPRPVLAAVDRLTELGIADPERVAVGGHSNGGYTTNVLVTQTNRFKAAITMAGMSNLTSVYGTFDPRFRYTDMAARDGTFQMNWAEAGQAHLGAPLAANLWAYLRNSPLFYADRIQTPVLFVHGDQDFVSMSEAEQLFTSLYRQGKRARLVRYWGEGHSIGASPANTRHMWSEIFAWLDEFCDVSRDAGGNMIFEGDRVRSRR